MVFFGKEPCGLVLDEEKQTLYFSDNNNLIRTLNLVDGTVKVLAGSIVSGFVDNVEPRMALFNYSWAMCEDDEGGLIIADCYNHVIRRVHKDGTGKVTTIAGNRLTSTCTAGQATKTS